MPRKVSPKQVQIVQHFPDDGTGAQTQVYQDELNIKWRDLKKNGIKRRRDKTGKKFLSLQMGLTCVQLDLFTDLPPKNPAADAQDGQILTPA